MKQFIDINGNPINEKLTVKKMLQNAICTLIWQNLDNQAVTDMLAAADKNIDKIVKTIERSMVHNMGELNDTSEIHFIAMVDGKAKCVRSMGLTSIDNKNAIQFNFVWSKEWTEKTIKNFTKDCDNTESVWANFFFVRIEEKKIHFSEKKSVIFGL